MTIFCDPINCDSRNVRSGAYFLPKGAYSAIKKCCRLLDKGNYALVEISIENSHSRQTIDRKLTGNYSRLIL